MPTEKFYDFVSSDGTFTIKTDAPIKTMYAPLCGPEAGSLKSSISPLLSGDIKIDKHHYLTKPATREDLRLPLREFFVSIKGKSVLSLSSTDGREPVELTVGQLWHQQRRKFKEHGFDLCAVNFIPSSNEPVELMRISIKNTSTKSITYTPTFAVPLFGRSLANKHDHEHVTALLNRVSQVPDGVLLEPTMAFNEEGHKQVEQVYAVFGVDDNKRKPQGSFPTVDDFYGDSGNIQRPQAVYANSAPRKLNELERQGKEAVGALRFHERTVKPKEEHHFIVMIGAVSSSKEALDIWKRFNSVDKFQDSLEQTKQWWAQKATSIQIKTGDGDFDSWMRWVTIQPVLRRIFGCSFLPDHDYGKGGKGWRDLWQDLLSLILIEPDLVRENLVNNCGGIRIDGSNATIIGTKPGEFIADRNAITRVWMDHGSWPYLTLLLYVHQSGDFDILLEEQSYFSDPQMKRSLARDNSWSQERGNKLLDRNGRIYQSSIIEHVLVQHLTQFFNVGEHNIIRLESADWNDGLDMAFARGESVAFAAFYAGNLLSMADLLEALAQHKSQSALSVAEEVLILLDTLTGNEINYDDPKAKRSHLFDTYCPRVQPSLSGKQVNVSIDDICRDLRRKGQWLFDFIRQHERVSVKEGGKTYTWFNGYYDNEGQRVEGKHEDHVRMTLTGQVFTLMSGLADKEQVRDVVESVEHFLRDKKLGGYRLNSDFHVSHYLSLGRAFGFAYGTKENGAFFSHMNVMYAYALLARGFAPQGLEVVDSIYRMAQSPRSKIYPGIPEYFDSQGRGMYHYLTGSASWLVLTMLTQIFGVRGHYGDLVLDPKLSKAYFDKESKATVECHFAQRIMRIEYHAKAVKKAPHLTITKVLSGSKVIDFQPLPNGGVIIKRSDLEGVGSLKVSLDSV